MRELKFELNYIKHAEGSVLVTLGETKIICNVTIEDRVPAFLKGTGQGWINAEYSLLPRSTQTRVPRESVKGKQTGRTMEISRLIARSLRACIDLAKLGEKNITVDCDVISADGGTRTASITGAFVALKLAIDKMLNKGTLSQNPIKEYIAAISVGIVDGEIVVDLDFEHDAKASVDLNLVMTESGRIVEIQGTGEEATYTKEELNNMINLAEEKIMEIIACQKAVLS